MVSGPHLGTLKLEFERHKVPIGLERWDSDYGSRAKAEGRECKQPKPRRELLRLS